MEGSAAALILGFLIASAYGALFHFIFGGTLRRLPVYLVAAWIGFVAGHLFGDFLGIDLLKLGRLYLLPASIGSWLALLIAWWLFGQEP